MEKHFLNYEARSSLGSVPDLIKPFGFSGRSNSSLCPYPEKRGAAIVLDSDMPSYVPAFEGKTLLVLLFLALVTLADGVLNNALTSVLALDSPQTPGFWNESTTALILSTVSDLTGQVVVGLFVRQHGASWAMALNTLSVLLASAVATTLAVCLARVPSWFLALVPILKIAGGGSHLTAFLAVYLIRLHCSGRLRSVLIYLTGGILVLCQTFASNITATLAHRSPAWAFALSAALCIGAYAITELYSRITNTEERRSSGDGSERRPLLADASEPQPPRPQATRAGISDNSISLTIRVSHAGGPEGMIGWALFVPAIAKATRPLFLTYIQHRVGVQPALGDELWMVRTILSLAIFIVLLPLAVIALTHYLSKPPGTITLYAAKISIIFMMVGAFLIGLAQNEPVLYAGLVINTLGVATDLSLLAYAADKFTDSTASGCFMVLASLESIGTLIGIGGLYPLYQSYLDNKTIAGGMPYYVCTVLFAVTSLIIWALEPPHTAQWTMPDSS